MPIRRRRYVRRPRTYRRRPRYARRRVRRRPTRANRVAYFTRYATPLQIFHNVSASTGGTTTQGYSFNFSAIAASGDFVGLFDQYRINGVQVKLVPRWNIEFQATQNVNTPRCYYTVDYDDSATLTTEGDVLQYGRCRMFKPNRGFSLYFKPSADLTYYNSTTSSGYGRGYNPWLDMGSQDIPHYGLKIFMLTPANTDVTATKFTWDLQVKYYFACKFTR